MKLFVNVFYKIYFNKNIQLLTLTLQKNSGDLYITNHNSKNIKKDKTTIVGYIIALDDNKKTCSFVGMDGKDYRRYGLGRCKLIQRQKSINFI